MVLSDFFSVFHFTSVAPGYFVLNDCMAAAGTAFASIVELVQPATKPMTTIKRQKKFFSY